MPMAIVVLNPEKAHLFYQPLAKGLIAQLSKHIQEAVATAAKHKLGEVVVRWAAADLYQLNGDDFEVDLFLSTDRYEDVKPVLDHLEMEFILVLSSNLIPAEFRKRSLWVFTSPQDKYKVITISKPRN